LEWNSGNDLERYDTWWYMPYENLQNVCMSLTNAVSLTIFYLFKLFVLRTSELHNVLCTWTGTMKRDPASWQWARCFHFQKKHSLYPCRLYGDCDERFGI
jgi:hypothetical protein